MKWLQADFNNALTTVIVYPASKGIRILVNDALSNEHVLQRRGG